MSDSVRTHRRQLIRLPSPWDSPGKNTGVGCYFLLQRIFPTQGMNPILLHCRLTLYHLSHQGTREYEITSVQFSHSVVSDSFRPHGLQPARLPCPSPAPGVCSKLMSIKSVVPSNHLILCCPLLLLPSIFPRIRVFLMSQFFASGGQSIGILALASVLPMNIQD